MPIRFTIGDELKSPFSAKRMKQHIPDWPILLDGLRRMWEIGKETVLETPFYEPFEKLKRILE